ncbi:Abi family protein [Rathayibacter sp. KR2-224]|uniref:Abi family protein n=1 Tax=Rathayibacter sp. KR2-224 TaxID=3400913 RepID=UPI003C0CB36D
MEYAKPWQSVEDQINRLADRGVQIGDRERAAALLREVGYYRLTGYLYPFRQSETYLDDEDRTRVRVLNEYQAGTHIEDAARLLDFDRQLRMLVLEAVERIEIALRMQLGYTLGRYSPFAHEDPALFVSSFTTRVAPDDTTQASTQELWLARVKERQNSSDEAFVAHFREKYEGRMPIWALTEILELGHIARLYAGLRNDVATEIATSFSVPTKRLMASWIATVNYVRNIAAHHARLFNRKLVTAPRRPRPTAVPLLAHLSQEEAPKQFGVYSALAVMAYLLESIHPGDWAQRVKTLLKSFPSTEWIDIGSMGLAADWLNQPLWKGDSQSPKNAR